MSSSGGTSGGGGEVTSVNSKKGIVVLTAADVGADSSGAASAAQTSAEGFATTKVSAEESRAKVVENEKVNIPSIFNVAVAYASPSGNNSNNGSTWASAKLSIQEAINSLPFGADGSTRNGIVELGYGTFEVESKSRKDKCKLTSGSAIIEDSSITSEDLGSYIVNASHVQEFAEITEVNAGVKFKINHTTAFTGEEELVIVKPAIKLPVGVVLKGRGRMNGLESGESKNYPTLIKDKGTGVTIVAKSGTGPGKSLPENASATRSVVEELSCIGNENNIAGYGVANCWGIRIRGCLFKEHGQWGTILGENAVVFGEVVDTEYRKNGTSTFSGECGGIYCNSQPNVFTMNNVRCIGNFGTGAKIEGVVCTGCIFSGTEASAKGESGVGVWASGAIGNGTNTLLGCWTEGSKKTHLKCGEGIVNVIGQMFQGTHEGESTPYAIESGSGTLNLDGCYFQNQLTASIKEANAEGPIYWRNCVTTDSMWIQRHTYANIPARREKLESSEASGTGAVTVIKLKTEIKTAIPNGTTFQIEGDPNKPLITFALTEEGKKTKKELKVSASASVGTTIPIGELLFANGAVSGSTARGIVTSPAAVTSAKLESGVAWQNNTGGDIRLVLAITAELGGTAILERGRTSSTESLGTLEYGVLTKDIREFYVPASWYFKVTLNKASFTSNAVIQPV